MLGLELINLLYEKRAFLALYYTDCHIILYWLSQFDFRFIGNNFSTSLGDDENATIIFCLQQLVENYTELLGGWHSEWTYV